METDKILFNCCKVSENLFGLQNAHIYLLYIYSPSNLNTEKAKHDFWSNVIKAYCKANPPLNPATDIVPLCGTNQAGAGGAGWQESKTSVLSHTGNPTVDQAPHAIFFLSTQQLKKGVTDNSKTASRMQLNEGTLNEGPTRNIASGAHECITRVTALAKHLATIWLLNTYPCTTIAALRAQYCSNAPY